MHEKVVGKNQQNKPKTELMNQQCKIIIALRAKIREKTTLLSLKVINVLGFATHLLRFVPDLMSSTVLFLNLELFLVK